MYNIIKWLKIPLELTRCHLESIETYKLGHKLKYMICILEGSDKVGKTTLAKHIEKWHGFKYIHCGQPDEKGPYEEYSQIIAKISKEGGNFVIDRFHLGEFVYGPIYRGRSGISQEQFVEIEKKLNDLNAVLIYCYDTDKNIAKRFEEDNEEWADIKKIQLVLDKYLEVLKKSRIPKYRHKMKGKMDIIENGEIGRIIKKWLRTE